MNELSPVTFAILEFAICHVTSRSAKFRKRLGCDARVREPAAGSAPRVLALLLPGMRLLLFFHPIPICVSAYGHSYVRSTSPHPDSYRRGGRHKDMSPITAVMMTTSTMRARRLRGRGKPAAAARRHPPAAWAIPRADRQARAALRAQHQRQQQPPPHPSPHGEQAPPPVLLATAVGADTDGDVLVPTCSVVDGGTSNADDDGPLLVVDAEETSLTPANSSAPLAACACTGPAPAGPAGLVRPVDHALHTSGRLRLASALDLHLARQCSQQQRSMTSSGLDKPPRPRRAQRRSHAARLLSCCGTQPDTPTPAVAAAATRDAKT
jgi:hypothetical protein